jgi:cation:H+ antiporter
MQTLLLCALAAIIAAAIIWKGSELLETASERLSAYYNLPPVVQGAIIVAVGSSFPELSTTVISTLVHGEFELGVSAIVGSAIFNILVIPGLSGLASEVPLKTDRDIVYKEAQFYIISVAGLLLTFSFAAIYNPVAQSDGSIQGTMTRSIALMPLGLYLLYLFLQWQDTQEYDITPSQETVSPLQEWARLALSLLIILVGVEILVRAAIELGDFFGTPSFLWGVTVVAAGTSIPDAFVSIRAAKQGRAVTSLANVLGSNIFDLLVCIPAGILIAGSAVINYSIAAPMMGALTLATLVLFVMMRLGMNLNKRESAVLIVLYFVFVLWMGLETFGYVDLVPSLPPHDLNSG